MHDIAGLNAEGNARRLVLDGAVGDLGKSACLRTACGDELRAEHGREQDQNLNAGQHASPSFIAFRTSSSARYVVRAVALSRRGSSALTYGLYQTETATSREFERRT